MKNLNLKNDDPKLLPPKPFQIMNYSPANFRSIGNNHVRLFNSLGVTPQANVLEIGSGNGRIASALSAYLEGGTYKGLDIMKDFSNWCQGAYSHYPNFSFEHIEVYNKFYNKTATTLAKDYTFKFEDNSFDLIYLTSVFTHMLTDEVENYLEEIKRMLSPTGVCVITFFIINDETQALMDSGKSRRNFKRLEKHSYTVNKDVPEAAMAFDEDYVLDLYKRKGLKIDNNKISFGQWRSPEPRGPNGVRHNQDRVVARIA